ncbi:MAG: outer membrane protein assembly factor BamD [Rhodospirillales bacterium]|nr:MAG: outer membrane protein assembly factor BamD [Rhodospirillales bacterium]
MNRKSPRFVFSALLAALGVLALGACSSGEDTYVEKPVEELYNKAMDSLNKGNLGTAAIEFDEVERQHPYSAWATQAQLQAAYTNYEARKYDEAIIALDRFIQLHPGHRNIAYGYYLKGLCYYDQIADVGRDQKMTQLALQALQEVVTRFPTSRYARDAQLKIDLTRDHLAGKEMTIGRYYQTQGHFLAAINRYKAVIEQYQTTTHAPEALHRLVECYEALGLAEEAKRVASVLGHNFPGSEWYIDSYQDVEGVKIRPDPDKPWWKLW